MAREENFSRRQKLQWNHMDAFSSRIDDDERAERYVEKILKKANNIKNIQEISI